MQRRMTRYDILCADTLFGISKQVPPAESCGAGVGFHFVIPVFHHLGLIVSFVL